MARLGITGLFVAFLLVASVTPVVLIGYVSYRLAHDRLHQQASQQIHQLVSARLEYLDSELSQIENLAANIRSVDAIISVLQRPAREMSSFDRLSTQSNIGYVLNSYLATPGIVSIDIFSETEQHFHVGDTLDATSIRQEVKAALLARAEQHPGVIYWAGVEPNVNRQSPHQTVLTAASLLWTVDAATLQRRRIGLLLINYDLGQIRRSLGRVSIGQGGYLIALDQLGRLIYHPDPGRIGEPAEPRLLQLIGAGQGDGQVDLEQPAGLVSSARSPRTGWSLVAVLPLSVLDAESLAIGQATAFVVILLLALIALMGGIFSALVVAPIRSVIAGFSRFQSAGGGGGQSHLPVRGQGEIAELVRWFNQFLDSVGSLQSSRSQLMRQQEALNQRVAELEQVRDALAEARDTAESANRAKSTFLAMMSHEIRTPLTGVISMGDFLAQTPLNPTQRLYIETMRGSAQTLLTVLNDILDYSKLDAHRLSLEQVPFDAVALAADAVRLFSAKAEENASWLTLDAGRLTTLPVIGDPVRLKQVLCNLISNAVKFTRNGKVVVRLRHQPAGDRLVLSFAVEDNGIGIEPADLQQLFVPFVQAENAQARKFGGTGLGLAISRRLASLMEGEITVVSQPRRGSVFTFSCPMLPATAEALALPGPAPAARALAPMSVLLAEDNPVNRMILKIALEERHHRVTLAEHGLDAVRLAASEGFDVILMDMHMPMLDGPAATRQIRALPPPFGTVPIVALSADALPEHRDAYMAAGLTDFLTKPIDWAAFDEVFVRLQGLEPVPAGAAPAGSVAEVAPAVAPAVGAVVGAVAGEDRRLLDRRRLDETRAVMDRAAFDEFIGDIVRFSQDQLAELAALQARGNLSQLRRTAHALKGMFLNIGGLAVADIARRVEVCDQTEALEPLLTTLAHLVAETLAELERLRGPSRELEAGSPAE